MPAGHAVRLVPAARKTASWNGREASRTGSAGRSPRSSSSAGTASPKSRSTELDGQALSLLFSLNQVHELGIREGSALELRLRADRIRVFADGDGEGMSVAAHGPERGPPSRGRRRHALAATT